MDFLTDKFLVDRNNFSGTVLVTGAGGCIGACAYWSVIGSVIG